MKTAIVVALLSATGGYYGGRYLTRQSADASAVTLIEEWRAEDMATREKDRETWQSIGFHSGRYEGLEEGYTTGHKAGQHSGHAIARLEALNADSAKLGDQIARIQALNKAGKLNEALIGTYVVFGEEAAQEAAQNAGWRP